MRQRSSIELAQARLMIQEMQDLMVTVESWASEMTGVWKAKKATPGIWRKLATPILRRLGS